VSGFYLFFNLNGDRDKGFRVVLQSGRRFMIRWLDVTGRSAMKVSVPHTLTLGEVSPHFFMYEKGGGRSRHGMVWHRIGSIAG
jgi:hypothetical protein